MSACDRLSNCIGINDYDIDQVKECLENIPNLNTKEVVAEGRIVLFALSANSFEIARLLVQHGADVNYRDEHSVSLWFTFIFDKRESEAYRRKAALFLLESGIYIPSPRQAMWKHHWARPLVEEYVSRTWSPENARDWPIFLRKQICAILCCVASPRRPPGAAVPPPFLLLCLFRAVAAAHFVYED